MFTFQLVTPEKLEFEEEIYEAILPTSSGQIAVLPGHIPLVTVLEPGVVSLRRSKNDTEGTMEHVAVSGGFAQITGETIRVLADSATRADDVDEIQAQEARERALDLKNKATDDVSSADATALLERSIAQLKLARLIKRHRH